MSVHKPQFPVFSRYPNLAYLDNAATTQKPALVVDRIYEFDQFEHANIHRGVYDLSNKATENFEKVRDKVASFIGAETSNTIAFTKGATESINVVARSFLAERLSPGDNLVTTIMEHHANFIPWQMLAREYGVELRIAPIDAEGNLELSALEKMVDERTKLVAVTHISNTLGTINPIDKVVGLVHKKKVPILVDAAQSAALYDIDVQSMGMDFLVFSGHKIFGPLGVGILYVANPFIDEMKPHNFGGGMVEQVSSKKTTFLKYPFNLDAGTANTSGVIGLGAAIDFIQTLDRKSEREKIHELAELAVEELGSLDGVTVIGHPNVRSGIVSFVVEDIHPHDVASFLNKDEIAVRAGTHCTQPLLESLGIIATIRASFSIYNDREEVVRLKESLKGLIDFWS